MGVVGTFNVRFVSSLGIQFLLEVFFVVNFVLCSCVWNPPVGCETSNEAVFKSFKPNIMQLRRKTSPARQIL